ncbi:MAG: hypothetical protein U1A27_10850 [Phycisphaerae bacterium]
MNLRSCRRLVLAALVSLGVALPAISQQPRSRRGEPRSTPRTDVRTEQARRDTTAAGMRREVRGFPGGDPAGSPVLVERLTPVEVRRGEEFTYTIRVINQSRSRLDDIALVEKLPSGFRVRATTPRGSADADALSWTIPALAPGASETLSVTGTSDASAELSWCATLTFKGVTCAATRIVEPALRLTKSMPPSALLCDDIPIQFVVTNTGSGIARGVRITDDLPAGLSARDGRGSIALDAGDLAAGQSREFSVVAHAAKVGEFANTAHATELGGLKAEASASTRVRVPALEVTKTGPNLRFVGRTATYEITVRNRGDATAERCLLTDTVPDGLQFVEADHNGRFGGGQILWNVGTLAPDQSVTVKTTLRCTQLGTFTNTASAKAFCAAAEGRATLEVRGIPAILLEVIDVEDPIEVGSQVTYEIVVTNQGSSTGTHIVIECTLPEKEEFVSATGPTRFATSGRTIRFEPLASLAPKARATYKVVVRGLSQGDVRFHTTMTSDQIQTPVEETESTNIY